MKTMIEKKKQIKEDVKHVKAPTITKMKGLQKLGRIDALDGDTKEALTYNFYTDGVNLYFTFEGAGTILDQDVSPTEYGDL